MLIKYNHHLLSIKSKKYHDGYYCKYYISLLRDYNDRELKPLLYIEDNIVEEQPSMYIHYCEINYIYYYHNNILVQISTISNLFRIYLHESGKYLQYFQNTDFYNFWNSIKNYDY